MSKPMNKPDDSRTQLTMLWTSVQPTVMAFISSMVANHADAEDVLQRTAYDIATNFEQYDPEHPFIAWAIGIAKYKVLDYRRDAGRNKTIYNDEALAHIASAYSNQSELLSQQTHALRFCLSRLNDKASSLINLRYNQGLKPKEIAEQVGTSANTISNALSRIRETLRECVKKQQKGAEQ